MQKKSWYRWLAAGLLVFAGTAYAAQPDWVALNRKLRSDVAAERAEAYAAYRAAGPAAQRKLASLLKSRLLGAMQAMQRAAAQPATRQALTDARKPLEDARAQALELIRNEGRYPDGAPLGPEQQAVDAAIKTLEQAWDAGDAALRTAAPDVLAQAERAREYMREGARPLPGQDLHTLMQQLTGRADDDKAYHVLGINAFAYSPERPVERHVLAQVNRYRRMLGLPLLRFDARLYRAGRWFARESLNKNIRGHYCDTPGKKGPVERAAAEGHKQCSGEAVAYNGCHFEDWLHSASHHRVLVDAQATQGAVAIVGRVAVLMIGTGGVDPKAAVVTPEQSRTWAAMRRDMKKTTEPATRLVSTAQRAAWTAALTGADAVAREEALREIAAARDIQMKDVVAKLCASDDPAVLIPAWACGAALGVPGITEKALEALKSDDPKMREAGAGALEVQGVGVASLFDVLEQHLSDYAAIRALEMLTGLRSHMHFGDTRETRETKVKAFKAAWEKQVAER